MMMLKTTSTIISLSLPSPTSSFAGLDEQLVLCNVEIKHVTLNKAHMSTKSGEDKQFRSNLWLSGLSVNDTGCSVGVWRVVGKNRVQMM